MSMLEIKNFTKVYPNGKVAVKDLSLTVSSGTSSVLSDITEQGRPPYPLCGRGTGF